jgi:glycosyltransferase involved in cell wall biosynthesis
MEIAINGRFLTQRITGVQRYARELVQAIDSILAVRTDLKVTVISPRLGETPPPWRHIQLIQVGHLQGHAWEQLELPWYSRGKLLFCPGMTAPIASLVGTQTVVVTVHDLSYRYFPQAYRLAFRLWYGLLIPLVLNRASSVITVSESERTAIIAQYPKAASRLHAIANGGLPQGLQIGREGSADWPSGYVLYVGSLSKHKNFSRMLDAASRLVRTGQCNFMIVGGTSKSLSQSVARIPDELSSKIRFVGPVDDQTLVSYYQNAICLLFPSLYEASGLPPIEAMACGCPVVASDISALVERCGDAAVYCDPHDTDDIVAAVEKVIANASLRTQLQERGYERAKTFTWRRCAERTLDVILASATRHHDRPEAEV